MTEGRKGPFAVVSKRFSAMDKQKLMIDSRLFLQVFLNAKTKFLDIMVVLFDKSISVVVYHFKILVFISFSATQNHCSLSYFFRQKSRKIEEYTLTKLPFSQTREVESKSCALRHSVGLIVRLCFKFHLTGPSRSMLLVKICKYQFFCSPCYFFP